MNWSANTDTGLSKLNRDYEIFMDKIQDSKLLLPAWLVSHHNLNISDTFFCDLQKFAKHQFVVEAEHL